MNYRNSQCGEGWQLDWLTWQYPYAYAERVDGLGGVRWEIVKVAPYTLEGIKSLVKLWEDNGRKGAVIYDGHMRGFPCEWVENALRGKGDPRHQSGGDERGATYGFDRLAFDHSAENPVFGFDHFGNREGVQL
jgi:hypothetical protein